MATFEYVEIPADAVRLKKSSLEPATKIFTSLPDMTGSSTSSWRVPAPEPPSPAKSAFTLVPQMLLSASIPSLPPTANLISSAIVAQNPRPQSHTLLSTRDPLSVPIMTVNFRRFVSKIGPVFWLQDRVEEIILWKKGWKRTSVWLAAYGFFCYFPKMTLLIPHVILLGVMLGYYPDQGAEPVQINISEGTADWQANIQAIQNLMGAFSDAYDAIVPLVPLLAAPPSSSPSPLKSGYKLFSMSTSTLASSHEQVSPTAVKPPTTRSNLQPHHPLLIFTLLSFFVLLFILTTDLLPLRLLFFLAGAGSVVALHPSLRGPLSTFALSALSGSGPGLSLHLSVNIPCVPNPFNLFLSAARRIFHCSSSLSPLMRSRTWTFALTLAPRDIHIFVRRVIDNDKLDDCVWRAPLDQVELWENERWVQVRTEPRRRKSAATFIRDCEEDNAEDDASSTTSTATVSGLADVSKGTTTGGTWSKANLKPNERVGWTRGRDGWSGVGGEVSSNLTFSLSPGWAFIETESWRPDLRATWAVESTPPCASVCMGADEDGWTYTTDIWTHPRPDARPNDGWVTRRRRWVRRVYFKGVER